MKNENSQNEPGMCLGINTFTFWCGPQTRSPRLAHTAKGAMYAPPEAGFGCASAPNRWERSRNVAWNQRFHKLRSYRGLMGPARTRCDAMRRRTEMGYGDAFMAVFDLGWSRCRIVEVNL